MRPALQRPDGRRLADEPPGVGLAKREARHPDTQRRQRRGPRLDAPEPAPPDREQVTGLEQPPFVGEPVSGHRGAAELLADQAPPIPAQPELFARDRLRLERAARGVEAGALPDESKACPARRRPVPAAQDPEVGRYCGRQRDLADAARVIGTPQQHERRSRLEVSLGAPLHIQAVFRRVHRCGTLTRSRALRRAARTVGAHPGERWANGGHPVDSWPPGPGSRA